MASGIYRRRHAAWRLSAAWLLAASVFIALGGCGGGGSSSSSSSPPPPAPPQTYALNSAISAYSQENHSYNLSATYSGNTFTVRLSFTAGSTGTFMGQSGDTATESLTLYENGTLLFNDIQTEYFLLGPYKLLGVVDNTTGNVWVASNQVALPDNATIGDSGAFDKETVYLDSTLSTVIGSFTDTWTLNSGPGSDAIGCLNSTGTLNGTSETTAECYTLDTSGNVTGLTVTIYVNGVQLKFQ